MHIVITHGFKRIFRGHESVAMGYKGYMGYKVTRDGHAAPLIGFFRQSHRHSQRGIDMICPPYRGQQRGSKSN